MTFHIVEILYPGLTQLDFTAPHTVFSRLPETEVVVASVSGGDIGSDGGLTFARTIPLEQVECCDLLFLPGGRSATEEANNATLIAHVRRLAKNARYITSVCNGSLILGAAGLLHGKRAGCHWAWRPMLELFGAIPDDGRVVRDGNIFTGGGVTAGIDFAFVLAAEIAGDAFAQAVQLGIEYAPAPPFAAGTPDTAPPSILSAVKQRLSPVLEKCWAEAERAAGALERIGNQDVAARP